MPTVPFKLYLCSKESVYGTKPCGSSRSGETSAHSHNSHQSKSRGELDDDQGDVNGNGNGNPFETIDDD